MNDNKLKTAVWEADRHLSVLECALADWQNFKVVDLAGLEKDSNQLRILDQLLFRFSKLQDAIGQKLVPATLSALFEIYEDWGMIDSLIVLKNLVISMLIIGFAGVKFGTVYLMNILTTRLKDLLLF